MWPFLREGDRVWIRPLPPRAGDVVLLDSGGLGPLHRVLLRLPGGRCWVKGDAALRGDGWISPERILGRVVALNRGGQPRRLPRQLPRLCSLLLPPLLRLYRQTSQ